MTDKFCEEIGRKGGERIHKLIDEAAAAEKSAQREPRTHDIVRNTLLLVERLTKHNEHHERAKNERRLNELNVLSELLHALPANLFDALHEKCDKLSVVKRDELEFYLRRFKDGGSGFTWELVDPRSGSVRGGIADVLDEFTLEEVLCGLITALSDRVEAKHEAARKVARVNRKLRGILSILDNS